MTAVASAGAALSHAHTWSGVDIFARSETVGSTEGFGWPGRVWGSALLIRRILLSPPRKLLAACEQVGGVLHYPGEDWGIDFDTSLLA